MTDYTQLHPVFARFRLENSYLDEHFAYGLLGGRTRLYFHDRSRSSEAQSSVSHGSEAHSEAVIEWLDLLEGIVAAPSPVRFVDLGAGYGHWLVQAFLAARQCGKKAFVVGVEAEPTHFGWMIEHLDDNGVPPDQRRLFNRPVLEEAQPTRFIVGNASRSYGQRAVRPGEKINPVHELVEVNAIGVNYVLGGIDRIDGLHCDIQGAEAAVLPAIGPEILNRITYIHIGTHSHRIEADLRAWFREKGWLCRWDFPCKQKNVATPVGLVSFIDGIQTWVNPQGPLAG